MKPLSPEKIRDLLTKKGLKITPQRLLITDYLLHHPGHPTADEVYDALKNRITGCSRATVYNTLNSLVDAEMIASFSNEVGRTRYDGNLDPHHHFIDTKSGKVYDIPWEQVDSLCERLGPDYKVLDYQINFYGEYHPPQIPKT